MLQTNKLSITTKTPILIFICMVGFAFLTKGQDTVKTLDTDKAFAEARQEAFADHHSKARQILYRILKANNDYTDASILIGRTYSWDKMYDSARYMLKKVTEAHPANEDALNALIDVELWSDNPSRALQYANKGLKKNLVSEDFIWKKIKALHAMGQDGQAIATADSFVAITGNKIIRKQAHDLERLSYKNNIYISSDVDLFSSTFNPWYYETVSYTRKTKFLGSLTSRLNYARRFDENGYQLEADAYPTLSKKMYAYVNAGFSPSNIFPKARCGASLYYNLPKAFEAELGFRYLYFSSSTIIYTGSFGKYYKNFWFSLRSYITPGGAGVSQSYFLLSRYYLGDADNYLTLTIGTGASPDGSEKDAVYFSPALNVLSSRKIKLDAQFEVFSDYYISLRTGFSHDEIRTGTYRENPSFGIGLQKRF
jgi:YaiO family outer membrane protein